MGETSPNPARTTDVLRTTFMIHASTQGASMCWSSKVEKAPFFLYILPCRDIQTLRSKSHSYEHEDAAQKPVRDRHSGAASTTKCRHFHDACRPLNVAAHAWRHLVRGGRGMDGGLLGVISRTIGQHASLARVSFIIRTWASQPFSSKVRVAPGTQKLGSQRWVDSVMVQGTPSCLPATQVRPALVCWAPRRGETG